MDPVTLTFGTNTNGVSVKEIPLTRGKFALVDDDDFKYLSGFKWSWSGRYAQRSHPKGPITLHREIMQPGPGLDVDHINGDKLDCRRSNMRVCTRAENTRNRAKVANGTSKYKGAVWHKQSQKWQARIKVDGKHVSLGMFGTAEAAGRTYDVAAVKYFGAFARLNFPPK